jgi:hypothetical protein
MLYNTKEQTVKSLIAYFKDIGNKFDNISEMFE